MNIFMGSWFNPHWASDSDERPAVVCPECGCGWEDDGLTDSEYGYFMAPDGEETLTATCKSRCGKYGCGHRFEVKRNVVIKVTYKF